MLYTAPAIPPRSRAIVGAAAMAAGPSPFPCSRSYLTLADYASTLPALVAANPAIDPYTIVNTVTLTGGTPT